MPKVSDTFSAYPVSVVLDGSGSGTVSFQATGDNISITKLFAKVSTTVAQAVVTIYKGQVGDNYAVDNSNSGSTGASASGAIGLMDGETVYVRWVGGDPGAIATATFSGKRIPFDQTSVIEFTFSQPFAAGDGSIIFPALQSPNYVPGVAGWHLDRNGNIDVAAGSFRGTVLVNGSNGSYVKIYANGAEAEIEIQPPTSGTATFTPGSIKATSTGDQPLVEFVGAAPLTPVAGGAGQLNLGADPVANQTAAQLLAQQVVIGDPSAGSTVQIESVINWGVTNLAVSVEADDTSVTNGTTTSTTFVTSLTTSGVRGVAFFAAPSGKALVLGTAGGSNTTVAQFTLTSFEVRLGAVVGSGVVIVSSDENTASQFQSQAANQPGQHTVMGNVTGLTGGSSYNACLTYRVTANTGTWNRRKIIVQPSL